MTAVPALDEWETEDSKPGRYNQAMQKRPELPAMMNAMNPTYASLSHEH